MAEDEKDEKDEKIELPSVNFTNFVASLVSSAFAYLGGLRDPETNKPIVHLELAKHAIDTLGMIKEKTKGNLTATENNFLENMLYDLKMSYVRAVNNMEREKQDEPAKPESGEKVAEQNESEKVERGK